MRYIKTIIAVIFILSIFLSTKVNANSFENKTLSDSAYIALLTCEQGDLLYSTFGHSAISVIDPKQRINVIFNYGTFNFNTPNFYLKFASGKLPYKLGINKPSRFLQEYVVEGRRVNEDKINLTQTQKQRLFDLLVENYEPNNRYYQYDFFFDNCATRVLNILEKTLGNSLKYTPQKNTKTTTFRNLTNEYLVYSNWSKLGINLALGSVVDKPMTEKQKAFLPDYLYVYLKNCRINGKPALYDTQTLVYKSKSLIKTHLLLSPKFWIWGLFIIITVLSIIFRHKKWIIADKVIFSVLGLIGVVLFLLCFASEHDAMGGNYNLLWANPLYIVFAWFIGSSKKTLVKWLGITLGLLNISVLLGWSIIPQEFHPLFIPLIGIVLIRIFIIVLRISK